MQKKSYFCAVFVHIMEKITKSQVKFIRSLQQKKFRDESGLFVAEGEKCVEELRKGFELEILITNSAKSDTIPNAPKELYTASPTEIEQMSSLRTPQGVIGVFKKRPMDDGQTNGSLVLVLDGIQDPGNLGTIIRTCNWFGVREIVCSLNTADCYNPKVVQATMGALASVHIRYVDLPQWLENMKVPIYGTLLDGDDLYSTSLPFREKSGSVTPSVIIMGNEGNGISPEVRPYITHPVRIPSYSETNKEASDTVESLNVSIATAIMLAEFRRP